MANIIVLLMTNFDEKFLDAFISTIILNLAKIIPAIRHLYPTLSPLLDERTKQAKLMLPPISNNKHKFI